MSDRVWDVYKPSDSDPYGIYLGMIFVSIEDDVLFLGPRVAPMISVGDTLLLDNRYGSEKLRVKLVAAEPNVPFAFHPKILGESDVQHDWKIDSEEFRRVLQLNPRKRPKNSKSKL